ncbi:MAG: hypothetical protein IJ401_00170, partial [Oscillospiraceae bacterium]|nr:hypothetical protein [Oscillospiraceae bacterium]
MNTKKKCPVIIICLLFALWMFIVPAVVGVILYMRNIRIDRENKKNGQDSLLEIQNKIALAEAEYKAKISVSQKEYDEAVEKKNSLLEQYRQEALESVDNQIKEKFANIDGEMLAKEENLKRIEQDISVKQLMLDEVNAEYEKSQKSVESNANKVIKLKEIYKSFQYAIKAYEDGADSHLNEALIGMAEQTLLPIVEMKLNCMNVKQLRARYNQEQKNIQEAFNRYEGRYTTKSNAAIYKLMVIALEAELQNVLYSLKFTNLTESVDDIKEITARYLS